MSTSPPYNRLDQVHLKLQKILNDTVMNTLLENRIPVAVASKLAQQVADNFNTTEFFEIIEQSIQDTRFPKQRVLDRTIVHMFEVLYRTINTPLTAKNEADKKEFFSIVPRGECLDLFLQLVKEYCMGDTEIEKHTLQIEPMIKENSEGNKIDWQAIYDSQAFKVYLDGLLTLILCRLRKDHKPIPALENKMPPKYRPYRINSFLNQVCLMYEKKQC